MDNFIDRAKKVNKQAARISEYDNHDIAIIGMDGRFPEADDLGQFWENLICSKDCVAQIPPIRKSDLEEFLHLKGIADISTDQCRKMGYLNRIDEFDYSFFGISKRESELIDPNQRLLLQTVWRCIENAGYGNRISGTKSGIFVGYSDEPYYKNAINEVDPTETLTSPTDYLRSAIACRIAYLLDLHGPSLVIDTACSSALSAVHYACQSIRNGECQTAIVGSIKINLYPVRPKQFSKTESQDGKTRTFDENAQGLGVGEGVAAILLKPLSKAIRDNDYIHAVIHGTAINQDGKTNGFTSPSSEAQAKLIVDAWKDANVNPLEVSYIETHGSATKLGDPIEISGIKQAFEQYTNKKQFCAIGSIKPNIGHLDHAAGLAGLLKAVLMLEHKKLLPNIHFERPNKEIHFLNSPVYISNQYEDWENNGQVRKCGVSSFGLTGVNCHVILGEANQYNRKESDGQQYVLTVSSRSKSSLRNLLNSYYNYLKKEIDIDIRDLCYTSNFGRSHYRYRTAFVASDTYGLIKLLEEFKRSEETDSEKGIYYGGIGKEDITDGLDENIKQKYKDRTVLLHRMCESYVKGEITKWELLYTDKPKTVCLPAYVFEEKSCWFHPYDELGTREDELYNCTKWMPVELEDVDDTVGFERPAFLLIGTNISEDYISSLQALKIPLITASFSENRENGSINQYFIDGSLEGYETLFNRINSIKVSHVIYLVEGKSNDNDEKFSDMEKDIDTELGHLLNFYKAIRKASIKSIKKIVWVADNVELVTGGENDVSPKKSMIFGLARAIGVEDLTLISKCIDRDDKFTVTELIKECFSKSQDIMVAYRDGKRYIPHIVRLSDEQCNDEKLPVKNGGVYVIAGGTGGIGLSIAAMLADKHTVNIALIGRKKLVDDIIGSDLYDETTLKIREITDNGSSVTYYQAELSCPEEVNHVLCTIRNRYGKIDGVIHSAGTKVGITGGLLLDESVESLKQDLYAKVHGTWCIDHYTRYDDLDFFILMTSPITWIGGIGISGYIASNAFQSTYSVSRSRQGYPTKAIGWAPWIHTLHREGSIFHDDRQLFKILSRRDIEVGWDKAYRMNNMEIVIGRINFSSKIMLLEGKLFRLSPEIGKNIEAVTDVTSKIQKRRDNNRFVLTGREDGNYTQQEKLVAKAWCNTLGVEVVDLNDNFFESGGHSLLAIKLEMELDNQIKYSDIYRYPTVKSMADYLNLIGIADTAL